MVPPLPAGGGFPQPLVCGSPSASGAGQWLHTPPCPAFQKTASPLLYKRMIQRWLRAPIFEAESYCPLCDEVMDVYGDHCLVCPCGGDRTKRHHLLRNETFHICSAAGLNPELEKPGLLRPRPDLGGAREDGSSSHDNNDARRPADVYLPRYRRGAPACLDFAATSGLRRSVLAAALGTATPYPASTRTSNALTWKLRPAASLRGCRSSR